MRFLEVFLLSQALLPQHLLLLAVRVGHLASLLQFLVVLSIEALDVVQVLLFTLAKQLLEPLNGLYGILGHTQIWLQDLLLLN